MSGSHKRNKEKFNKLFRKITRKVSTDELRVNSARGWSGRMMLNQHMTVSKFTLLAKETRKWSVRKPEEFRSWVNGWDLYFTKLEQLRYSYQRAEREALEGEFDELVERYFEGIGRFVGGNEGSNPEARVKALLEKRRAKVTNKMARSALWAPGSLLEVSGFMSETNRGFNFISEPKGWFIPFGNEADWNHLVASYSNGRAYRPNVSVPEDIEKSGRAVGIIFDEVLLSGETETYKYCWIRLVRVLAGAKEWVMILHPSLTQAELHKNVKVLSKGKTPKGFTLKTVEANVNSTLRRALRAEGKFDESLIQ